MSLKTINLLAFSFICCATLLAAEKPLSYYKEQATKVLSEKYKETAFEQKGEPDKLLVFQHNLRKFTTYHLNKMGNWQKPREQSGPDRGGILVTFKIVNQPWEGALKIPASYSRDFHVFKETLIVKNSVDNKSHIWVRILTPKVDSPEKELKSLIQLFNEFGQSKR